MGAFDSFANSIDYVFGPNIRKQRELNKAKITEAKYIPLGVIWEITPNTNATNSNNATERIIIDHNINFQETGGVEWGSTRPRGALGSLYTYNSTTERKFPLTFTVTDYDGSGTIIKSTEELLRRWTKPITISNEIHSPPPILGFYYNGFVEEIDFVHVILENYTIAGNETQPWAIDTDNPHPYTIEINMNLTEINMIPNYHPAIIKKIERA